MFKMDPKDLQRSFFKDLGGASADGNSPKQGLEYIQELQKLIQKQQVLTILKPKNQNDIQRVGCILLIQLIKERINRTNLSLTDEQQKRVKYFKSNAFIQSFVNTEIPHASLITSPKASYKKYLDTIFNPPSEKELKEEWDDRDIKKLAKDAGVYSQGATKDMLIKLIINSWGKQFLLNGWRGMLASKKPATECHNTIGNSNKFAQGLSCYICGRAIIPGPGQATKECEHILAVTTALSHWWVAKKDYSDLDPKVQSDIALEYDWAHQCCNQIKAEKDLIIINNGSKGVYVYNDPMMKSILEDIYVKKAWDCKEIRKLIKSPKTSWMKERINSLKKRLKPLLKGINQNIKKAGNPDIYKLLCKYKIIAAFDDQDFINIILGYKEVPKSKTKQKATKKIAKNQSTSKKKGKQTTKGVSKNSNAKKKGNS